ncbi:alpha-(1,3)-fucosyltransferase fut-6-like [Dreissena polymorpha]|uniref:alpha-(1,3)-fucosyltransferase fut-6-like n=1 Tax=Dreissena polymorpha TaxID=45954 RepID=UPI002263DE5D|nr:alpha-(1,3)-fucosyltransferase fut-6-like [Dreissena polymorpha]
MKEKVMMMCFVKPATCPIMEDKELGYGRIDSVFNMKRPYDLVAFMKQEDRAAMLDKLKQELLSRKDEIDRTEDRNSGLEDKFYKSDVDCLAGGKQLPDLDLYISTVLPLENKGIRSVAGRPDDYLPPHVPASDLMQPDCTFYTDLEYSPHAFEHLEGMKDRKKLSGTPELGLKNAITYQDNVDEYGHQVKHTILYWNKPFWMKDVRDACLNCEVITNRSKARDASAIVFFGMADGMGKPPLTLEERNPNQAWIFSSVETPLHMFQEYMSPEWQGKFNWTWTYRPSATFFQPYGIMLKKEYIPEKNYSDIFHRKSKLATWIVSHCQTDSKREIYVGQMNTYKNGTVDIFGGCGKYKPTWGERDNLIKDYKFYISFENSFCSDYFTEKFFSAFSTDIIPVVRGGADYTKYVPNGTYIDTQDFRSPKELVDYLMQMASDEKMYTEILRRKDRYQLYAGSQLFGECVCRICQKLNDIDKNRATIINNLEIMGDCRSPKDLR